MTPPFLMIDYDSAGQHLDPVWQFNASHLNGSGCLDTGALCGGQVRPFINGSGASSSPATKPRRRRRRERAWRRNMSTAIKFGTSGWRAVVADEFTVANIRLAVAGIAEYVKTQPKPHRVLVGRDP